MLTSLQLRNYRCFDHHDISFRSMNVIVGANNAGKSTLVEALRVLSLVSSRYGTLAYGKPPAWASLPARYAGVRPAMQGIDLRGGSVFHRYGDPPATLKAQFTKGEIIEVYVGPANEVFGVVFDANGKMIASKAEARHVEISPVAILPQIGPLLENEPLLTEDYVLRSADSGLASRHFRNQMHFLKEQCFDDFVQRAESSWHGLHIESLNVEGSRPDAVLSLHIRDSDFVAEAGWMGHGLQMWLQTMWFLSRARQADTVILDEPDVYMHADLQRRLIRVLRAHKGQTIIATHSVEIMSEVEPESILVVDKGRRQSSFASSLPVVQNAIDRLGGVHNIHLARLWGSQRCLHVEGKDIAFLKALQDILYPQADTPFDVIPRLSIGGWGGWPYAIGSSMSLKNAAGQSIATYCVLDSDYHTEEEIAQRYEESHQHGVRLHVWSLKEIENYLIVPAAIVRIIAETTNGKAVPKGDEVVAACEIAVSSLRDAVFDSLSHEYLIRDRGAGVHGANKKARERIDQAWATLAGRLGIVSGKDLVSELSAWSKKNYGVSFGPLRIARELKGDEVASEVKAVVRAIEKGHAFPKELRASAF
ncbi:MAG: AAA family ATPase [Phycisphaerales bacterium]